MYQSVTFTRNSLSMQNIEMIDIIYLIKELAGEINILVPQPHSNFPSQIKGF